MSWIVFIILCGYFSCAVNGSSILPFTQRLQAPNRGTSGIGIFGRHVAVSADGLVAVVGDGLESSCGNLLPGDTGCPGAGAAYVYSFVSSTQMWVFSQYLKPTRPAASFLFGCAVAVSGDGSVIAVSSCKHKANGTGVYNSPDPGTAESTLGNQQNGALYMFQRQSAQGLWSQVSFILRDASTNQGFDFGSSLAISDSGSIVAACSAQFSLASQAPTVRTIHIFNSSSGFSWSLEQLVTFDDTLNYGFGFILGLSGDGQVLAAGSYAGPPTGQPCVFFYQRSPVNASWTQTGGPLFTASTLNNYLYSRLAVSGNGNTVVVPTDFGFEVLQLVGGIWKHIHSGNTTGAGSSLTSAAISSAGDVIAVASNSVISVFAKGLNGSLVTQQFFSPDGGTQFGNDLSLSSNVLLAGDQSVGTVYTFPFLSTSIIGTNVLVSGAASIAGNYTVGSGVQLSFSPGAVLNVAGTLFVNSSASILLYANTSGSFTFIVAESVFGSFSVVRVANSQCTTQQNSVSSVLYTSSTISAVVSLPPCSSSSDSLSTGAIIGIAVGAACFGILLAVAIAFVSVRLRRRYNEKANQRIKGEQMTMK